MKRHVVLTTLYVNVTILKKISLAADRKKISSNEIISILLRKMLKKYKSKLKLYKAVKYQKKDPSKLWKRMHVKFKEVDYELFTDQRKFFKMSVSLLLTNAVEKYLEELLREDRIEDNYLNYLYKITHDLQKDYIIWHVHWDKSLISHQKT